MQRSTGVVIATAIGVAAIVAPILISIRLAWNLSLSDEKSNALSYAQDVLRRSDETADQFGQAINQLNHDHLPPCSSGEIDIMRQIELESNYIQAVGRISGNTLICTSLDTSAPISVGPPDLVTESGVIERNQIRFSLVPSHRLSVLSKDGVAIIIDPGLVTDTRTEGPGISIAVFVPSSLDHSEIASGGKPIRPQWRRVISKGTESTFIDGGYVVAAIRPSQLDIEVIAAVPEANANRRAQQFALEFVPIGLLCGAGLAWAVLHISQIQLSMKSVIQAGLRRGEFFLLYQPIVQLSSGRWVGAEALIRWQRGDSTISPDLFIPSAEQSGIITLITAEVAKIVTKDLPQLVKIDSHFNVAINLSAKDLSSEATIDVLQRLLQTSGAHSSNLEIEATERGFLQGLEAREILARIRDMGIGVAIDDFGTGYSSLSCLQTLGLDTLKIDKAFVDTIDTDGATSHVVLHIIEMAHSLNLEIVAEGVETEAQAEFLKRRGVHYAQGWLFGKPMAIATFCEKLAEQREKMHRGAEVLS